MRLYVVLHNSIIFLTDMFFSDQTVCVQYMIQSNQWTLTYYDINVYLLKYYNYDVDYYLSFRADMVFLCPFLFHFEKVPAYKDQ